MSEKYSFNVVMVSEFNPLTRIKKRPKWLLEIESTLISGLFKTWDNDMKVNKSLHKTSYRLQAVIKAKSSTDALTKLRTLLPDIHK